MDPSVVGDSDSVVAIGVDGSPPTPAAVGTPGIGVSGSIVVSPGIHKFGWFG